MPKSRPDTVQVVRFELQEKERDLAEMYIASRSIENLTKSVDNLVTPAVAAVTAYVAYKSAKELYNWAEDWFDGIRERLGLAKQHRQENPIRTPDDLGDSTVNPFDNPGYSEDGGPTNIFGLPGWGIWPGVL